MLSEIDVTGVLAEREVYLLRGRILHPLYIRSQVSLIFLTKEEQEGREMYIPEFPTRYGDYMGYCNSGALIDWWTLQSE